ncbi:MAG: arsenate reductase ArsC [Acidimicrobiia bacterium]|nr:arsenate reductase ArsC [Acidimicrobiia bacterium]
MTVDVLILCTGNRCRSQMAEGWLRTFAGDRLSIASAGLSPSEVHPIATAVMAEVGIDLSGHTSKHVDTFADVDVETVVTVCDSAAEACPTFPSATRVIHRSFEDPDRPDLPFDEQVAVMRSARDEIASWARAFVEDLVEGQDT